jgi:hypothetical protein
MDLGFYVKRVFTIIVLALETTFYFVLLSYTRAHMMGRFSIDDNYVFKSEKLGIIVMFFVFFMFGQEWCEQWS